MRFVETADAAKHGKGEPMELHPVGELRTDAGKREADRLSDLGVKDSSMAFIVDDDGAELVTVTPAVAK